MSSMPCCHLYNYHESHNSLEIEVVLRNTKELNCMESDDGHNIQSMSLLVQSGSTVNCVLITTVGPVCTIVIIHMF